MRRPSPAVNRYPDRDLLHYHVKNTATSIVPGITDFNNAVKFGGKVYIRGISMIKGIWQKKFNLKLDK